MIYLIKQINDSKPTILLFADINSMREYLNGATAVGITENVYFTRIKQCIANKE